MISYYLERGHNLKELCNLSKSEKVFMGASASYWLEYEQNKLKLQMQMMGIKI